MSCVREKVVLADGAELERRLRACLERRELPDAFLYTGEAGSENWLRLDSCDDFPVASDLGEILQGNRAAIAKEIGERNLVSIGVGDGVKERVLLKAMGGARHYCCVDVSERFVDMAIDEAEGAAERIVGVVSPIEELERIRAYWERPVAMCLLGNNFCNFEPDWLLERIRGVLGEDGLFVFDCSLLPVEAEAVERVYNSRANRLFNAWPLLERGLAEDAYEFELKLIRTGNGDGGFWRTQKRITVTRESFIRVDSAVLRMGAGETIEMGLTYKYVDGEVGEVLGRCGFEVVREFYDDARANVIVIAKT